MFLLFHSLVHTEGLLSLGLSRHEEIYARVRSTQRIVHREGKSRIIWLEGGGIDSLPVISSFFQKPSLPNCPVIEG